MRAPLLGDVVAAARSLGAVPADERDALLGRLVASADAAARHWRRTGRSHPRHGDGSLMAAALAHGGVSEPSLEDRDYCLCLARVLTELAGRAGEAGTGRPPLSA